MEPEHAASEPAAVARARARQIHPKIKVGAELWARQLAVALRRATLEQLDVGDLWLVCGCAEGDREALGVLERRLTAQLALAVARYELERSELDELIQDVRSRLLVAPPGHDPKILQYEGRGSLAGWLRIVATRVHLNRIRARAGRRAVQAQSGDWDEEASATIAAAAGDPELWFAHEQTRDLFARALKQAFFALEPRIRTLLRQHFLDGVTMTALARLHGVHVATLSRWLADARARMVDDVRRVLARSSLGAREVDELVARMSSDLDLSLRSLLRSPC